MSEHIEVGHACVTCGFAWPCAASVFEARYERLRLACYQEVPEDGPFTFSGYCCLLCGWDADPQQPDTHEPSCELYAAEATA